MIGITFLAIALLLLALKELITSFVIRRKRKEITHKFRVECTQRHFAEARNQLMQLVIEGKLAANSDTFKNLYGLHTGIMRRPDYYPEISHVLAYNFLKGHDGEVNDGILRECKQWTPEIKQVVIATADAMSYLITNHSFLFRALYWFEKKLHPNATPTTLMQKLTLRAEKVPVKKDPVVKEIRRTQVAMYQLAEAY